MQNVLNYLVSICAFDCIAHNDISFMEYYCDLQPQGNYREVLRLLPQPMFTTPLSAYNALLCQLDKTPYPTNATRPKRQNSCSNRHHASNFHISSLQCIVSLLFCVTCKQFLASSTEPCLATFQQEDNSMASGSRFSPIVDWRIAL